MEKASEQFVIHLGIYINGTCHVMDGISNPRQYVLAWHILTIMGVLAFKAKISFLFL